LQLGKVNQNKKFCYQRPSTSFNWDKMYVCISHYHARTAGPNLTNFAQALPLFQRVF